MDEKDYSTYLGKRVALKRKDGKIWGKGIITGYCDSPVFSIEMPDRQKLFCRTDMCELLPDNLLNIEKQGELYRVVVAGKILPAETVLEIVKEHISDRAQ